MNTADLCSDHFHFPNNAVVVVVDEVVEVVDEVVEADEVVIFSVVVLLPETVYVPKLLSWLNTTKVTPIA